jgi:hypothetical protein
MPPKKCQKRFESIYRVFTQCRLSRRWDLAMNRKVPLMSARNASGTKELPVKVKSYFPSSLLFILRR